MELWIEELRNLLNKEHTKSEKRDKFVNLINAIEENEFNLNGAINYGKPVINYNGKKRKHENLFRLKDLPEEYQKKIINVIYEYAKSCVEQSDEKLREEIKKITNCL